MSVFQVRVRNKATGQIVPTFPARASYDGGSTAPRMISWRPTSSGPNAILSGNLNTLRSRSRDRRRNDPIADTVIEVLASNIIGTGIRPQFNTSDAGLNAELADLWEAWTDESDADGRMDFYGQQYAAVVSMLEGGDMFTRMRTRRMSDGLIVPLQLQMLESEFCPVEETRKLSVGYVQQGIEFDAIGARVAYYLYRAHPNDQSPDQFRTMELSRVPAREVCHLQQIRRLGAIRGEPALTRLLVKLMDMDKLDDSIVVRAGLQNIFVGFVTPSADQKFDMQTPADEDGTAEATIQPGTVHVLKPGEQVNWNEPPDIGNNYETFQLSQQRRLAASAGILYEQLTGDYSKVNDRTWRAAMNEFWRRIEPIQHNTVVFQLCRPVVRAFLAHAIMAGAIKLPSTVSFERAARPKWVTPKRPYINPVQDVAAKVAEVRAGFGSRAQKVSEDGYDIQKIDEENQADYERADRLGLKYDSDGRYPATASIQDSGQQQQQET